ncbi:hypothetical protein D9758_006131 [Tetrapyrgos nigripes]|uniref:Cytochrome P450 n=1 Tax=Tetrapyrgos nigripes TaxID=182062 RepID=A0A8H5GAR2_9AGAR|nr:hypothetical protein D9758_006131 [Tetrapyrgos nigripes]
MAYYDVWKGGAWIEQLQELHRLYGTYLTTSPFYAMSNNPLTGSVVRVAPNQLHFSDPQAYADIYSSKSTKDPDLYGAMSVSDSLFTQTDPREVLAQEGTIQSTVDTLIRQLLKNHSPSQTPANLELAFRSTAFDIITAYCFAKSINAVSHPGFHHDVLVAMDGVLPAIPLLKHFRIVKDIILSIPHWLAPILIPSMKFIVDQISDVIDLVETVMRDPDSDTGFFSHRTIFHSFLDGYGVNGENSSTTKRRSHPVTKQWLVDEGLICRFTGSDGTVSSACVIGCQYVLADREVLGKLVKELDDAWPDASVPAKYELLEKLPYLTGVVKESLRLSHRPISLSPRIVGTGGATIAGHFVPEGISVSMADSFVHLNPGIFIEPERFKPERWLQSDSITLEKYLVAFGNLGPRSCIGINLAWCELYLIMGNIFRRLELAPTMDVSSPYRVRDCFIPLYDDDLLHVVVTERLL